MTEPTPDPKFVPVDLTELQNAGVLMAANETFFWPLGLALTWEGTTVAVDKLNWCKDQSLHEAHVVLARAQPDFEGPCKGTQRGDKVRNLHVRQWEWADGHREIIEVDDNDEIAKDRRRAFVDWIGERLEKFPILEERLVVAGVLDTYRER